MKTLVKRLFKELYATDRLPTNSELKTKFPSLKISSIESWCKLAEALMSMLSELNELKDISSEDISELPENQLHNLRKEYEVVTNVVQDGEINIYKNYPHKYYDYPVMFLIGKVIIDRLNQKISASIGDNRTPWFKSFESVKSAIQSMIDAKEKQIKRNQPSLAQRIGLYH